MEAAERIPRRVPVPHLRPRLDLCKPSGVTLDSKSRVVVVTDQGGIGKALIGRLKRMGVDVLVIGDTPEASALIDRLESYVAKGPVQGVYWLPALDPEPVLGEMDLPTWREATRLRVKLFYATMRTLYDQMGPGGTFLVSATRLGGQHGYGAEGAASPMGGAVAGFTKSFKREKSGAHVKVVDFEASRKTAAFANLLVDETLYDPGVVEVGYKGDLRWTVGLEEIPASDSGAGVKLGKDTVFLVTGAAGSIVSAIVADLAAASGGTFHLLDLTPTPDPDDADVRRFATDKEDLKRDIFGRLKDRGERATPAMVEKVFAGLERSHAALSAIQAIEGSGGDAHYYSVNLLDEKAVAEVVRDVIEKSGRIDVLLHAAGLEISHLLPNKSPEEFDLVFDVKSDGWFNLLSAIGESPLGAAVVFSSIAGRFGNAGQTDYSAANDLLCKSVSSFRTSRPGTRGLAIDWTAWGGIGMAARGSIPEIMKQAGIDMLTPEAGIPVVQRELTAAPDGSEVVIAGRLGIMHEEFDDAGGLDISPGGPVEKMLESRGIMVERLTGMGLYSGLTIEATLDPAKQPFLYDHQIDGTPVLPGVMGLEALVEAAKLIFPDRYLGAIENVNFLVPFKFYHGNPRTVTVHANFGVENDDIIARCRLAGSRTLHGKTEPEITTHFTARVRLMSKPPRAAERKKVAVPKAAKRVDSEDIYRLYFHGPAYRVVENSWRAGEEVMGLFAGNLPANHEPASLPTLVEPRLIELCFQTAGIFELAGKARMGLPYRIDRVDFLRSASGEKGKFMAAVTSDPDGAFGARVVDEKGDVYMTLRGYRTMELPNPIEAELLKPLQAVLQD
jgi:NAD(P)-dependent dehydrogenase (short-subunit alcohol dehydrogenase family)